VTLEHQRTPPISMNRWIIRSYPNCDARLRLFCLPCAGGDTWLFRDWERHLPQKVDVCPIRLPGRGARIAERPFTALPPLVHTLARALAPFRDIPFAVFGYSMGAVIAFELARCLRRGRDPGPVHLFPAGCRAPHWPEMSPPIHQLPDATLAAELVRRYGAASQIVQNRELMRIMLPTIRADFAICETYVHILEPPLPCPITVFGGICDSTVDPISLDAWRWHTDKGFSLRLLPGHHSFITNSRRPLLATISEHLEQSLS
jgi:medium-chain acyl-[acyl-carrier-protein] hydrolase